MRSGALETADLDIFSTLYALFHDLLALPALMQLPALQ